MRISCAVLLLAALTCSADDTNSVAATTPPLTPEALTFMKSRCEALHTKSIELMRTRLDADKFRRMRKDYLNRNQIKIAPTERLGDFWLPGEFNRLLEERRLQRKASGQQK